MMNTYDYNGFDALDTSEYDDLMQEMAEASNDDYFTNELEKDFAAHQEELNARYQLIIVWNDLSSKSENTDDIVSALNAAAIYIMDSTCIGVSIYDWQEKKTTLDWHRF